MDGLKEFAISRLNRQADVIDDMKKDLKDDLRELRDWKDSCKQKERNVMGRKGRGTRKTKTWRG